MSDHRLGLAGVPSIKGCFAKIAGVNARINTVCREYEAKASGIENFGQWEIIEKKFLDVFARCKEDMDVHYENLKTELIKLLRDIARGDSPSHSKMSRDLVESPNHVHSNTDELRKMFSKRTQLSTDNMVRFLSNIELKDTKEDLHLNCANVYHFEMMADDMMIITGSEGFVGKLDMKTEEVTAINRFELTDSGSLDITVRCLQL